MMQINRWKRIGGNLYKYSMGYEANGVGDLLFEDFRLRLDDDPQSISFVILSVSLLFLFYVNY